MKHKTNVESLTNIWRIKSSFSLSHQSLIITICCNYLLASNYLYLEFKSSLVEYNHLTASIFMGLLVLVCFSFYKEKNLKLSQGINMSSHNDIILEYDKVYNTLSTSRLRSLQETINWNSYWNMTLNKIGQVSRSDKYFSLHFPLVNSKNDDYVLQVSPSLSHLISGWIISYLTRMTAVVFIQLTFCYSFLWIFNKLLNCFGLFG